MFKVTVRLNSDNKTGLTALDFCRKMGLPDATFVQHYQNNVMVDVDEAFARLNRSAFQDCTAPQITVDFDDLLPGELQTQSEGGSIVVKLTPDKFTPARVAQLAESIGFSG